MADLRTRWEEHYASGHTPWDTQVTPPEVQAFWNSGLLPTGGIALDVGCGPGTNVLYLARLGMFAVGFDIASQAVTIGRRRIVERSPQVAQRAWLVQADITALPLDGCGASYILDLGCSHGLPPALRPKYAQAVIANLRAGGYYHLFAFDHVPQPETSDDDHYMGMLENEVIERFAPHLDVVQIDRARPDRFPCRWYLLRKREGRGGHQGG